MARLAFQGSLYYRNDGPFIPAHVLEGSLVNGAKKSKDGLKAKSGMFVEKGAVLEYNGPRDREGLWNNEDFRFTIPVVINRMRIMRTRPIFNEWAAKVIVNYDDSQVNESQILRWIQDAGLQVGLGDWRPRYGRFVVEKVK